MKLVQKTLTRAGGRSMYLYFPEGEMRTAFRRHALTILRDDDSEESVRRLLEEGGLSALAEQEELILAFPNPIGGKWNAALIPFLPDDVAFIRHIQGELNSETESRGPGINPGNKQELRAILGSIGKTWHARNDTLSMAGFGTGASMVMTLAALAPTLSSGIYAAGGTLCPEAVRQAKWAPMPACLVSCDESALYYFQKANGAMKTGDGVYRNDVNPYQTVLTGDHTLPEAFEKLLRKVRRTNTSVNGDIERRMGREEYRAFELHLDETCLPDGLPHTWFTAVPESVRKNPDRKVPLMMFFHGGSDNPAEAADMSKFHELGEREGFITVYPWGANKLSWNSNMECDQEDDDAFIVALVDYMIGHYPVDPGRVYLSGFSNGAAQAQTVAMCHPDRICAICPIDSNWPGERTRESEVDYNDEPAMRIGLEFKKNSGIDYRIPNWYTYGGREPSYPVFNKSTQQHQYDYWKLYDNVTVKPTPARTEAHPCGCGVPGDIYQRITPSAVHPAHAYDAQRFLTNDPGQPNLYNFVVMLGKGHDVAEKDPELGWNFVKQFRREQDGSISLVK